MAGMIRCAILLTCLTACSTTGTMYSDTKTINLNVVPHEEVIRIAEEFTGEKGLTFRGYAIWAGDLCQIWIVPKETMLHEELWHTLLGHELRHCFEGHFHD